MSVTQVDNLNSVYLADIPKRNPGAELGKNEFLQLLMTQMKYQDPLQPVDNGDYIAQMAQLSTLEQMTNMTHALSLNQAFQLIGKSVIATVPGTEFGTFDTINGEVERVITQGSSVILIVDGKEVSLEDIYEVSEKESEVVIHGDE